MFKIENKKAQAAIELAVFGAILIFILGTIVRSAVGNGFSQNENFKAMRMAMLDSWNDSKQGFTAHNTSSVIFVEDRLSPDLTKYGDMDRNPFIAQGSGTFSYELEFPWNPTQGDPIVNFMPIMDVYINGQHFPFTTAAFNTKTITQTECKFTTTGSTAPSTAGGSLSQAQCLQNQCLRNNREWEGNIVSASQFDNIMSVTPDPTTMAAYGVAIFQALINAGIVGTVTNSDVVPSESGYIITGFTAVPNTFSIFDPYTFLLVPLTPGEISAIQSILQNDQVQYKLFYTAAVNGSVAPPNYVTSPPFCPSTPGEYNALCSNLTVLDAFGNQYTNTNGDMQYDLLRLGNYVDIANPSDPASVENQFGTAASPLPIRSYMAWQWAASPAISEASIGLDPSSNQYPTYDIDGRLKEVTVYGFSQSNGIPTVSYEDYQGGDIDGTWDTNSCSPKPGLQNASQIYTFTKQGTYLQIKEGKLYNPETDLYVRSVNQRDTIDLIQRTIQLSNNTGRFCTVPVAPSVPVPCPAGSTINGVTCASPNPVEACVDGSACTCFMNGTVNPSCGNTIVETCYDTSQNMLYVRSRIEDRRGHSWMTDASGQLQVH